MEASSAAPSVAPIATGVIEHSPQDVKDVENLLQGQPTSAELAAVEADVVQLSQAAPVIIKETKAGYKTTEFWAVIATSILDVVSQIPFHDKLVVTVIAGLYAVARGLAKLGVPNAEPTQPV